MSDKWLLATDYAGTAPERYFAPLSGPTADSPEPAEPLRTICQQLVATASADELVELFLARLMPGTSGGTYPRQPWAYRPHFAPRGRTYLDESDSYGQPLHRAAVERVVGLLAPGGSPTSEIGEPLGDDVLEELGF